MSRIEDGTRFVVCFKSLKHIESVGDVLLKHIESVDRTRRRATNSSRTYCLWDR